MKHLISFFPHDNQSEEEAATPSLSPSYRSKSRFGNAMRGTLRCLTRTAPISH